MNAQKIAMIFRHVKLVVVINKEAKIRLAMLKVETVIVCQMFVVQNVTNVNVITFQIHFRIAKVSESLQVENPLSILDFRMQMLCYGNKGKHHM